MLSQYTVTKYLNFMCIAPKYILYLKYILHSLLGSFQFNNGQHMPRLELSVQFGKYRNDQHVVKLHKIFFFSIHKITETQNY